MSKFICIGMILFSSQANAQNRNIYKFIKGDTTLNYYLYKYLNENIPFEKYDTLCDLSSMFIKFHVKKGKISGVISSQQMPAFLAAGLRNALLSTEPIWKKRKGKNFLLPVFYFLDCASCRGKIKDQSAEAVLTLLQDLNGIPGNKYLYIHERSDSPIDCIILNPIKLNIHYD